MLASLKVYSMDQKSYERVHKRKDSSQTYLGPAVNQTLTSQDSNSLAKKLT